MDALKGKRLGVVRQRFLLVVSYNLNFFWSVIHIVSG